MKIKKLRILTYEELLSNPDVYVDEASQIKGSLIHRTKFNTFIPHMKQYGNMILENVELERDGSFIFIKPDDEFYNYYIRGWSFEEWMYEIIEK